MEKIINTLHSFLTENKLVVILIIILGVLASFYALWPNSNNEKVEVKDSSLSYSPIVVDSPGAKIDIEVETNEQEPILEYEIKSPSQKQSDGLYHTIFEVRAINIALTELIDGKLRYDKNLTCDTANDENINSIMASSDKTGGLLMSGFQITISCTSEVPVPEDNYGRLFEYVL